MFHRYGKLTESGNTSIIQMEKKTEKFFDIIYDMIKRKYDFKDFGRKYGAVL